ncbi:MAG: isochorismatase family protein [Pseudonocardiaceae bacterium]
MGGPQLPIRRGGDRPQKDHHDRVWTEVCVAFPTLDMLREGYEVYPVSDAIGGISPDAHDRAMQRMIQAGAQPITAISLVAADIGPANGRVVLRGPLRPDDVARTPGMQVPLHRTSGYRWSAGWRTRFTTTTAWNLTR